MSDTKYSIPTLDPTGHAPAAPALVRRRPTTVVVGGGISGLATAHFIRQNDGDCIVLEGGDRTGGVIRSRTLRGRIAEFGPQRTRCTHSFQMLIADLGLESEVLTAPPLPLFIYSRGSLRSVPCDPATLWSTDLISWWDRLRMLAEPFTEGIRRDESAAEFFIRKFGRGTYAKAIAPLFGDLYGSDPVDMPARFAVATMLESLRIEGSLLRALLHGARSGRRVPACTFRNGLEALTNALADRLGDRLHTGEPVESIVRSGQGFRVVTHRDAYAADRVVLTCPAPAAAGIVLDLDPDLSGSFARLTYNQFAVVHLLCDEPFEGSGYQVGLDAGLSTRGVTCNEALFDRRNLYTAFLGGAADPKAADRSDAALGQLAAEEFHHVTGHTADAVSVYRTYMPSWDWSWTAMEELRLPDGLEICSNWTGRSGIGARISEASALARRLVRV